MCPSGRSLRPQQAGSVSTSDFRPAFDVLDVDRDGKISHEDLRMFYAAGFSKKSRSGDDITEEGEDDDDDVLIGTMMKAADSNKDGFVEYDEFERVLLGNGRERLSFCGVMEDAFRVMDKDGDGKLSYGDLKSYMEGAGFAATDEDIEAMIKFGGGESNGGVTFGGLLRILAVDFPH